MPIASSLSPVEDPRKIDSTWHIPPGWRKHELGLSQLTRVMNAVGEKMGAKKNCIKRVTSNVLTQSGKSGLSQTCEQVLQQRVGVVV